MEGISRRRKDKRQDLYGGSRKRTKALLVGLEQENSSERRKGEEKVRKRETATKSWFGVGEGKTKMELTGCEKKAGGV